MICSRCYSEMENGDSGSDRYQECYNHSLPTICEKCLNKMMNNIKRRG